MEDLTSETTFPSIKEAKECISSFCVRNRHKFIVKRSCLKKYSVICKDRGCGFFISCYNNRRNVVKVTTLVLEHSCDPKGANGPVSANTAYIARKVRDLIADNPAMTVAQVMSLIKQEDGIDVPYWAAWKGRKLALTHINEGNQTPQMATATQLTGRPKRLRSRNIRGPGRKCSNCGIVAHHNARTCERRRQTASLPKSLPELPDIDVLDDYNV